MMPGPYVTSVIRRFLAYQRALGFLEAAWWMLVGFLVNRNLLPFRSIKVRAKHITHPMVIRMQRSSDSEVFEQVFLQGQLDFAKTLREIGLIVDLGANIGLTAVYLLNLFPTAHLIAIEPDPANAKACRANLAPYGSRARFVEGGIWHRRTGLMLCRGTFADGRGWATRVREPNPGESPEVEAYDFPSLLEGFEGKRINFLKIDIEGSEEALFSSGTGWLGRVDNLCVEMHDQGCETAVRRALESYEFEAGASCDCTLFLNLRPKREAVSAPDE